MDVRSLLHPRILEDVISFKTNLYNPQYEGAGDRQELRLKVSGLYGRVWMRTYRRKFVMLMALMASIIASATVMENHTHAPIAPAIVAMVCAIGVAGVILWTKRNRQQLSLDELKCLYPAMGLTKVEDLYCQTFVTALESKTLGDEDQKEIINRLNELMSAHQLIDRQRLGFTSLMSLQNDSERKALEQKIADVKDESARQALQQSLDMLNRRIASSSDFSPYIERLDAQDELISQTLQSIQQTVARAQTSTRLADYELEDIRSKIANVNTQIEAVEKAVQELNSI